MALSESQAVELAAAKSKWLAQWPEWQVVQVFVPATERALAEAWFAWLAELAHAAWGGTDAAPGMAKLAWWQEELAGWAKGARRHPLGAALQPLPVDWAAISQTLGELKARDLGVEGRINALTEAATSFAAAVASAEHAMMGGTFKAAPERVLRTLLITAGRAPDASLGQGSQHGPVARRVLDAAADLRAQSDGKAIGRMRLLWKGWQSARSR